MPWLLALVAATASPKIIEGDDTLGAYPAVGVLFDGGITLDVDGTEIHTVLWGVSTLIAPDVVLTSGHVVDDSDTGPLELSWFNHTEVDDPPWSVAVSEVVIHPGFSRGIDGNARYTHDIALAFLAEPVTDIAPRPLASRADTEAAEDTEVMVIGYGPYAMSWSDEPPEENCPSGRWEASVTSTGDILYACGAGIQRSGWLTLARTGCKRLKLLPDEQQVFAGDSGGPVLSDQGAVLGLVSGGTEEATRTFVTRVDRHLDWIDETMREGCASGRRVWCDEPGLDLDDAEPAVRCCQSIPAPQGALLAALLAGFGQLRRRRRHSAPSASASRPAPPRGAAVALHAPPAIRPGSSRPLESPPVSSSPSLPVSSPPGASPVSPPPVPVSPGSSVGSISPSQSLSFLSPMISSAEGLISASRSSQSSPPSSDEA